MTKLPFEKYLFNDHLFCPNYYSNSPQLITYEQQRLRLEEACQASHSYLNGRCNTNKSFCSQNWAYKLYCYTHWEHVPGYLKLVLLVLPVYFTSQWRILPTSWSDPATNQASCEINILEQRIHQNCLQQLDNINVDEHSIFQIEHFGMFNNHKITDLIFFSYLQSVLSL